MTAERHIVATASVDRIRGLVWIVLGSSVTLVTCTKNQCGVESDSHHHVNSARPGFHGWVTRRVLRLGGSRSIGQEEAEETCKSRKDYLQHRACILMQRSRCLPCAEARSAYDLSLHAPVQVYDYYAGGADTESTVRDNRAVYARYRLLPRYMVDVSHCDMTYTLLGMSL